MTHLLRPLAAVLVGLLAAQFLLGMITNLYAPIPPAVPGLHGNLDARLGAAARWALLHGPPELKIHVVVGLATGGCAIAPAVLALRTRQRPWRLFALLGGLPAQANPTRRPGMRFTRTPRAASLPGWAAGPAGQDNKAAWRPATGRRPAHAARARNYNPGRVWNHQ